MRLLKCMGGVRCGCPGVLQLAFPRLNETTSSTFCDNKRWAWCLLNFIVFVVINCYQLKMVHHNLTQHMLTGENLVILLAICAYICTRLLVAGRTESYLKTQIVHFYLCTPYSLCSKKLILYLISFYLQLVSAAWHGGYNFYCQNTHSAEEADIKVSHLYTVHSFCVGVPLSFDCFFDTLMGFRVKL